MRLAIGLFLCASLWGADGDITACRIIGNTTGVADVLSATNVSGALLGAVLECDQTVPAGTTASSYALGIGALNTISGAKIRVHLTSPTPDGGTTPRTVYGTHQLRQVYQALACAPDPGGHYPCPNDVTVVDTTMTHRIALGASPTKPGDDPPSGYVYSGDTNVTVDIDAGALCHGAGPTCNPAVTALSVTNNSTAAYQFPIFNWSQPYVGQRITGSTQRLCVSGLGQAPHDGMPVRSVTFTITDGTHSPTATATKMGIEQAYGDACSPLNVSACYVQEYCADVPTATLTQAAAATAHFAVSPWLGTSAAILNTDTTANPSSPCVAGPSPLCSPVTFIVDTAGTFGTAAALVDDTTGDDTNSCAVTEATWNPASPPNPCKTIRGAAVKMRVVNNANASPARADIAGTIYVKAGTYKWTGSTAAITASSGTNPDKVCTTVTPFSGVARASVIIDGITDSTYNKLANAHVCLKNLTVAVTAGAPSVVFQGGSGRLIWFDQDALSMTSGTGLAYSFAGAYWTRNSTPDQGATCGAGSTTCCKTCYTQYSSTTPAILTRGNNLSGVAHAIQIYTFLGNYFGPSVDNTGFQVKTTETAIPTIGTMTIAAFNRLHNLQNLAGPVAWYGTQSSPVGGVYAMNETEWTDNANSPSLPTMAADGSTNTPVDNVMAANNTGAGQRPNICYNDKAGDTTRLRRYWGLWNNLFDAVAMKSDTFPTALATRVGNWTCEYGVGWRGNMDAAAPVYSAPGSWQPEFPGIRTNYVSSHASIDLQTTKTPPSGTARLITYPGFLDRKSYDGVSKGAGKGDYRLKSSSPAIGLVGPGGCVFPYDLAGKPCNNSGYGSPGVDEAAARMTPVFGW